ncbi:hypothetical protein RCL_jg23756.t1 [Rhizophagus clarus]|uniref:Uncharacterized protein n=1 Tax=Rhizophagus clarus TaxID=94130 RepID=A0A8H3LP35_9GLOM|nr:hypothetical protein RCL_jg23756.t1 [Rhizophagus clarus]
MSLNSLSFNFTPFSYSAFMKRLRISLGFFEQLSGHKFFSFVPIGRAQFGIPAHIGYWRIFKMKTILKRRDFGIVKKISSKFLSSGF